MSAQRHRCSCLGVEMILASCLTDSARCRVVPLAHVAQYQLCVRGSPRSGIRLPLLVLVVIGIVAYSSHGPDGDSIHHASSLDLQAYDIVVVKPIIYQPLACLPILDQFLSGNNGPIPVASAKYGLRSGRRLVVCHLQGPCPGLESQQQPQRAGRIYVS